MKEKLKALFQLKGQLPKRTTLIIEISGLLFFLLLWYLLTYPFVSPKISYNASFGQAPYTYEWTGPDGYKKTVIDEQKSTDLELTGLKTGEYNVTISDSRKNSVKASIILDEKTGDASVTELPDSLLGIDMTSQIYNSIVDKGTLPRPYKVLASFKELHFDDLLLMNTYYSIKLNVLGYIEAIVLSLLIGFIIGLLPFFRSLMSKYIDAIRFVPLAAVTGIFIAWFGIEMNMKVQFLAFGIIVFLLPVVVQRIDEVDKIYSQTAYTLGASGWQIVRHVYWPHVTSKLIDDVRVLTAISWTYIIVAELVNADSGLGKLIFVARRQSRLDKVFALLIIIIVIGILQDLLFKWIDRMLFPHRYVKNK